MSLTHSGRLHASFLDWWADLVLYRSAVTAREDMRVEALCSGRRFSLGTRPVIRWVKGDGLDDNVTRAAIGQATRLFGNEVDYCLCTQGIDAARARTILEWATQAVEWWPISEEDNSQLALLLKEAGCEPENFGYWWKWFPERVRPEAPEWILDGDMVITGKPDWYQKWADGLDVVRLSQDDAEDPHIYGQYVSLVNLDLMLYSGLLSLPPNCRYMPFVVKVLTTQPLQNGHNGKKDMSEQGVIAAAFQYLNAVPIPLYEFPFCRAFQGYIDYGLKGDQGKVWGYHFGNSFVMENAHVERLTAVNIIFSRTESSLIEKFQWLGGHGQWGVPGWTITDGCARVILDLATGFEGKSVLELGTSRGRLTAMLATLGGNVTTVDRLDRGAGQNLLGLNVNVVVDDAKVFLETSDQYFDLIVCDLHGNSIVDWKRYSKLLIQRAQCGSVLIISNALLYKVSEWHKETGVQWFLKQLPAHWHIEVFSQVLPGVVMVISNTKVEDVGLWRNFIALILGLQILVYQISNIKLLLIIRSRIRLLIGKRILNHCNLFDEEFYLEKYPDVEKSGMSAVRHYLLFGGFEGRNPSERFDSALYLEQNPDVKNSGMNPLIHYVRFGDSEGRRARS